MPQTTALILSHPGHELRVHHWLERTQPVVFVLTDGSGHTGHSRLSTTSRVLAAAGAHPGAVYGRVSDRDIYAAMMRADLAFFTHLAHELAAGLRALHVTVAACDAAEGYNPTHDVCRYLAETAVALASNGHAIAAYDFPLVAAPTTCPSHLRDRAITITLDEPALDRKIAAARSYQEIAGDVERALAEYGRSAFSVEVLRPQEPFDAWPTGELPWYERHGEDQVAAGHYTDVLRFRDHVEPVAASLRALVEVVAAR